MNVLFWRAVWMAFARLFVMLGLPLLGWGVADVGGFFENSARVGIATLAFAVATQVGVAAYRMPAGHKGSPHDEEHWHYSLLELVFILAAYGDRRNALVWDESQPLRWFGVGIYLLGMAYAAWANWTWVNHLRREGERSVAHSALLAEGPFTWTRYPVMTALFCYHFGFTLAFRSWVGLAFTLPITYVVVRRAYLWDRVLAASHPKEWRRREWESKRCIPFVF